MTKRDDEFEYAEEQEFTDEELEQMFREAEEEEPAPPPLIARPGFRKLAVGVIALVLLVQVLAFWPQIFSMEAIRFLKVSAQLMQSEEVQQYRESVVVVRTQDSKGTGFVVTEDGLIVTNRHVIEGDEHPVVTLHNGEKYIASIVSISEEVDLALLDIDGENLPVLSLADRYNGTVGESIYVIGNPLFFTGIANEGETLGLMNADPPILVLQAPIYKGNSGSPVIDANGEVLGVVYATSRIQTPSGEEKVGLAVPVQWILQLQKEIGINE